MSLLVALLWQGQCCISDDTAETVKHIQLEWIGDDSEHLETLLDALESHASPVEVGRVVFVHTGRDTEFVVALIERCHARGYHQTEAVDWLPVGLQAFVNELHPVFVECECVLVVWHESCSLWRFEDRHLRYEQSLPAVPTDSCPETSRRRLDVLVQRYRIRQCFVVANAIFHNFFTTKFPQLKVFVRAAIFTFSESAETAAWMARRLDALEHGVLLGNFAFPGPRLLVDEKCIFNWHKGIALPFEWTSPLMKNAESGQLIYSEDFHRVIALPRDKSFKITVKMTVSGVPELSVQFESDLASTKSLSIDLLQLPLANQSQADSDFTLLIGPVVNDKLAFGEKLLAIRVGVSECSVVLAQFDGRQVHVLSRSTDPSLTAQIIYQGVFAPLLQIVQKVLKEAKMQTDDVKVVALLGACRTFSPLNHCIDWMFSSAFVVSPDGAKFK